MLFCHITSKIKGEKYPNLLTEKAGAWPSVCFMNGSGDVVAMQNYRKMTSDGVDAFKQTLATDVKEFYDLQKKANTGDKKAKAEFFMRRFELGHLKSSDLAAATKKGTFLNEDQVLEVKERLIEILTEELLEGVDYDKPATFGPFAKKLLEQHKTIGLPEGPSGINPWIVILEDAYLRKDVKTFEMAFTALKAAGLSRRKKFVEERQKQLAELKKGAKKK